jgi:release factor glutamine methyltransferase
MKASRQATDLLRSANVPDARREASLLMAHLLKKDVSALYLEPDLELSNPEYEKYEAMVSRRAKHEPFSHITGYREFWSLEFRVGPDVLDPRADSETLIEAVLAAVNRGLEIKTILDLGTGSGCLLLSLLSEIPGALGTGIDISAKALEVARLNAKNNGLSERASFMAGNWCRDLNRQFDLVVSNPPYIPDSDIPMLQEEVRDYEPLLALKGGKDGLDCYREIVPGLNNILRPSGLAVFEVGIGQANDVADILQTGGFSTPIFHQDLSNIDRCVSASRIK